MEPQISRLKFLVEMIPIVMMAGWNGIWTFHKSWTIIIHNHLL